MATNPVYAVADAVDPTDSLLYGFNPATGAVVAVGTSPLRPVSAVSNVALGRRPSDGHFFVASGNGWVYEWTSDLVGIQQFGTTDPAASNALQPSNTIWTLNGIQFLGSDVWLFWSGGGFTTGNICAQRRDPITFALRDSFTIDNSILPTNNAASNIAYGLNRAATVLFLRAIGTGVAGQNNIYAYTIASNTVAPWGAYGVWTPPNTGWFVREFRVLSDDRIVALYHHDTAGIVDDAHLVVFAADGSIVLDFAPEDSTSQLSVTHLGVDGDFSLWTAQDYYNAGLDANVTTFRNYAIATGIKIGEFAPPQQDALGFIVQAPPVGQQLLPPPPSGSGQTLVFDVKGARWFVDQYTPTVTMRTQEPGEGVHNQVLGERDGSLAVFQGTSDQGQSITYGFQVPTEDAADPRADKQFGDLILKCDPQGSVGLTITPAFNDGTVPVAATVLGAGQIGEGLYRVPVNDGDGLLARNITIQVYGSDIVAPVFYLWEPAFLLKVEVTGLRVTDWDDAGYFGAKFVQGVLIEADTFGAVKGLSAQYDGGLVGATFSIDQGAQDQTPRSFPVPFIAHLLRLAPTDDVDWRFYRARWVWEPSPELVAHWITQPTTHDLPGYQQQERYLIAYISDQDARLVVTADGVAHTYDVPSSSGLYVKREILARPNKGKAYQYALQTISGLPGIRVFVRDLEIRVKPWGSTQPYAIMRPFGDISRESGARI